TVVVADVVDEDSDPASATDASVQPVPAAAPVVVGAAEDGVSLSAEAAAALRGCLPDMPFDSTAPMAGARVSTQHASTPANEGQGQTSQGQTSQGHTSRGQTSQPEASEQTEEAAPSSTASADRTGSTDRAQSTDRAGSEESS